MPPHQHPFSEDTVESDPTAQFAHYIGVLGQDANGNYNIVDPTDATATKLTPDQVATFLNTDPTGEGFSIAASFPKAPVGSPIATVAP